MVEGKLIQVIVVINSLALCHMECMQGRFTREGYE